MSSFVHLHCHTEYSLLDGAIRLKDLCAKAKEFGSPAAAITDHGVMYGAASFYSYCREYGIKPILGCEVYVAKDHQDKTSQFSRVNHHLILLAQDDEGYHNLVRLVTRGCLDGYYYHPRVDKTLLRRFSKGIIALSACIAGEIPRTLLGHNRLIENGGTEEDAIRIAHEFSEIYPDRFYLEVQANSLPEQAKLNKKLMDLASAQACRWLPPTTAIILTPKMWKPTMFCCAFKRSQRLATKTAFALKLRTFITNPRMKWLQPSRTARKPLKIPCALPMPAMWSWIFRITIFLSIPCLKA